ncbi:MAG: insulinase family protein [Myxococcaceae bacterium]|nr:insulinase family protein [Myxococcaceae bacterium]
MNALRTMTLGALAAVALAGCATAQRAEKPADETAPTPATTPPEPLTQPKSAPEPAELMVRPLQPFQPMQTVVLADPQKPIVTFRLVFKAGSVDDPKGKEGITALTAKVMAEGGTEALSSSELLEALFPMAAELSVTTDKEFTAFTGRVHKDNLDRFFDIFTDVLLHPRFDPKEFERLRTDAVNQVRNELRGQDDETFGKVALDALIYEGTPYAHYTGGTVQGLSSLTLEDIKAHWKNVFTQDRLIIGLAGAVDDALKAKVTERLAALPPKGVPAVSFPKIPLRRGYTWILEKPVLSTAISMGYTWDLRRGDPDYFPIALALSYLGEHRQFNGVLFNELREKRGLNYGDYAYAEHFIQEGWGTFALTNIGRSQQDFSIWLRPVESPNALFATRGAVYFLDRLVKEGIPEHKFELTRGFLMGYTRLWEQSDARRLGYAIDSIVYDTPNFLDQYRAALQKMTVADVNAAVKRHLSPERLNYVFVAPDAAALKKLLVEQPAQPLSYPTPKPPAVLEEDKRIAATRVPLDPQKIEQRDVAQFMER